MSPVFREMIAYGYWHLSSGQLGEANRYLGNTEVAIDQYRKTLALDPGHPQAPGRLAQRGAGPEDK